MVIRVGVSSYNHVMGLQYDQWQFRTIEDALETYAKERPLWDRFGLAVNRIVKQLLEPYESKVQITSWRIKDVESLRRKFTNRRTPPRLADVTDFCGVRIITFFSDDVASVSSLIEQEFTIDYLQSIDKQASLNADRFGYLSVHSVVELKPATLQMTGYGDFSGMKCEIQIRSALQNVWAEINHDLGYKTLQSVPRATQRRLSRVAGLLELADAEFCTIRNEIAEHNILLEERRTDSGSIALNETSLAGFLVQTPLAIDLDSRISRTGAVSPPKSEYIQALVLALKFVGIETVADLEDDLQSESKRILAFGARMQYVASPGSLRGCSTETLCMLRAIERGGWTEVRDMHRPVAPKAPDRDFPDRDFSEYAQFAEQVYSSVFKIKL
jgi:putative GTP pyrophosphokinase